MGGESREGGGQNSAQTLDRVRIVDVAQRAAEERADRVRLLPKAPRLRGVGPGLEEQTHVQ